MSTHAIAEAIALYNRLLTDDPDLGRNTAALLDEGMKTERLYFGGRPLCNVLRPNFLIAAQAEYVRDTVRTLVAAIEKLGAVIFSSDSAQQADRVRLLDDLGLTDQEARLLAYDSGYPAVSAHSRLDSFLSLDGTLHFVEYNAESPAGAGYEDGLGDLFETFPVMQKFSEHYNFKRFRVMDRLVRLMRETYAAAVAHNPKLPDRAPHIAIVDWDNVPTTNEFLMCKDLFERNGMPTIICTPTQLTYDNGKLRYEDFEIDLLYKRVLISEILTHNGGTDGANIVRAYEDGAICMVNSFQCKIYHKKMIFGLLTDDANQRFFSAEEQAAIAEHIPWTRRVRAGASSYKGDVLPDLLAFVRENRDRLVIKPNDEYGGKGVAIGWEANHDEWEAAIAAALAEPFVVQEKVQVAKQDFPTYTEGRVVVAERLVDMDPYIFDGEMAGVLTRLAATSLLNVTAGTGSVVPTFIIEPK